MCIGAPGRLVAVDPDGRAEAEIDGRTRTIVLTALDRPVRPGDHVLVVAGLAVAVLDADEAGELSSLLREARGARP